jgi:hypothetical protein
MRDMWIEEMVHVAKVVDEADVRGGGPTAHRTTLSERVAR